MPQRKEELTARPGLAEKFVGAPLAGLLLGLGKTTVEPAVNTGISLYEKATGQDIQNLDLNKQQLGVYTAEELKNRNPFTSSIGEFAGQQIPSALIAALIPGVGALANPVVRNAIGFGTTGLIKGFNQAALDNPEHPNPIQPYLQSASDATIGGFNSAITPVVAGAVGKLAPIVKPLTDRIKLSHGDNPLPIGTQTQFKTVTDLANAYVNKLDDLGAEQALLKGLGKSSLLPPLGETSNPLGVQSQIKRGLAVSKGQEGVIKKALPALETALPDSDPTGLINLLPTKVTKLLPGEVGQKAQEKILKQKAERLLGLEEKVVKPIVGGIESAQDDSLDKLYQGARQDIGDNFHKQINSFGGAGKFIETLRDEIQQFDPLGKGIKKGQAVINKTASGALKNPIASAVARGFIPSIENLSLLANNGVPEAGQVANSVALQAAKKHLHKGTNWNPLKDLAEEAGVLQGSTGDKVLMGILNSFPASKLAPIVDEALKTPQSIPRDLGKRIVQESRLLNNKAFHNMGQYADLLESGKFPLNEKHLRLISETIKTNKSLAKLENIPEEDLLDAYMYRIWNTKKDIPFDEYIKQVQAGVNDPQAINPKYLERRYGKEGYNQSWWRSMESRIDASSRALHYDPLLKLIAQIDNNQDLHPFLKDVSKDIGKRILGTMGNRGTGDWDAMGVLDGVGGTLVKNILNTPHFAELNSLQGINVLAEHGEEAAGKAAMQMLSNQKQVSKVLRSLGLDLDFHNSGGMFESLSGAAPTGPLDSLIPRNIQIGKSSFNPQQISEGVKNLQGKIPRTAREGLDLWFNKGIFLHGTERNNVQLAVLASLQNHFKKPLPVLLKELGDTNNTKLRTEASAVAMKSVSDLIFVGNELNKNLMSEHPLGKIATTFTRFPITQAVRLVDWAQRKPEALARWAGYQSILGGTRAITPAVATEGLFGLGNPPVNRIDFNEAEQRVNPPAFNLPSKTLDTDLSRNLQPFGLAAPFSLLSTGSGLIATLANEDASPEQVQRALSLLSPWQSINPLAGSIQSDYSIKRRLHGDKSSRKLEYQEGTLKTGKTTVKDVERSLNDPRGVVKAQEDVILDTTAKQVLNAIGNEATTEEGRKVVQVLGAIKDEYKQLLKIADEAEKDPKKQSVYEQKDQIFAGRLNRVKSFLRNSGAYLDQPDPEQFINDKMKFLLDQTLSTYYNADKSYIAEQYATKQQKLSSPDSKPEDMRDFQTYHDYVNGLIMKGTHWKDWDAFNQAVKSKQKSAEIKPPLKFKK